MKNLVAVLALFILVTSCKVQSLECTAIKDVKVERLDNKGIEAKVVVTVKNPNKFSFKLYRSAFDVEYSGIKLGQASLKEKVKIKANKEEQYAFYLSSEFKDLSLTQIMQLLAPGGFKNELHMKGTLYGGKFGLRKGFPVDLREHINLGH